MAGQPSPSASPIPGSAHMSRLECHSIPKSSNKYRFGRHCRRFPIAAQSGGLYVVLVTFCSMIPSAQRKNLHRWPSLTLQRQIQMRHETEKSWTFTSTLCHLAARLAMRCNKPWIMLRYLHCKSVMPQIIPTQWTLLGTSFDL